MSKRAACACMIRAITTAAFHLKHLPADTKFVAVDKDKPSVAVLSVGCGTTSQLSHVDKDAGLWGWAGTGMCIQPPAGPLRMSVLFE